jgi:class 3 adenylate cyclase
LSDPSKAATALTIMMIDVVGSTALRRARGDADTDDFLALLAGIVHDKVMAFGGRVRKSLGEGFLISFPSTAAAVRAAADIQMALLKRNTADPQRAAEIGIGIHTGQVTEQDGDLYGQAVRTAARVTGQAAGGQILTSEEVREDAEPLVDWPFLDSGLFWLRGFPERWRLYEVSWSDTGLGVSAGSARLTPFMGRDVERASLRRLVDDALAGDGRLALVAGEPGIGKSRLVSEIGKEARARGMQVLTGHCVDERRPTVRAVRPNDRAGDRQPSEPVGLAGSAWRRRRRDRPDSTGAAARLSRHPAAHRAASRVGRPLRVAQFQRIHRPRIADPALIAGIGGSALGRRVNPATH